MSKHKLLLADDSVTIQKVVNLTFADEGIEVISVGDGDSAMEKFVELTPDLVMVDVNMPGVDGYRICEMIKQDETTRNVPVILLVGSFEPFDEEEARRVGADDYLTKPFQSIRQLVNKVTVLLNKANGQATAASPEAVPATPVEETIEQPSESEYVSPLGDAGMDDDMIQANQIGSVPIGDLANFGDPVGNNDSENRSGFPSLHQVDSVDRGKTTPFTAEEFSEFTSETGISMEDQGTISDAAQISEPRTSYLEEQMVSEFESETADASDRDQVEFESPQLKSPEDYFSPNQISEDEPLELVEIPEERGFDIDELIPRGEMPFDEKGEDSVITSQPDPSAGDFYSSPATPAVEPAKDVQEISVEPESPEVVIESDEETVSFDSNRQSESQESVGDSTENRFAEALETETGESEPQESSDGQFFDEERFSASVNENESAEEPQTTAFGDEHQNLSDHPESLETGEEYIAEPATEQGSEHSDDVPEASETPGESVAASPAGDFEEFAQVEQPDEVSVESDHQTDSQPESAESVPQPDQATPETTHSKVSSLVSSKDTTDAVESVIISEFARQSISLSAAAVETIASRIAEKISEKIVQEMASEVVSELADLIVAKMEQKKQQN